MARSPMPRSCLRGVTTPRTMFWSSWSIMRTRPNTHIGHSGAVLGAAAVAGGASGGAGVAPSVPGSGASSALDGDPDERAVFRPGTVVVLDVLVAQQLAQDEPGVSRPLTDAAVGDDVLVRHDVRALVEALELVRRLERSVLVGGLAPRDVGSTRDVARHLGLLLGEMGGGQQLAAVLLGRPDVDELDLADLLQD